LDAAVDHSVTHRQTNASNGLGDSDMSIAMLILDVAILYIAAGFVFAVYFVTAGLKRFDHQAAGAPVSFRLIVVPGAVVLWPVLIALSLKRRRIAS